MNRLSNKLKSDVERASAQYEKKSTVRKQDRAAKSNEKEELVTLRNKFSQKLADVYVASTHKNGVVACHALMR